MERLRALELLAGFQDRILDRIARAEALTALPPQEARPGLAKLRWEVVRLIREYQLFKHTEIFDPLIASSERRTAALAIAMKARCVEANDQYVTHVKRWSMSDVAAEWDEYRDAMRTIGNAIRVHFAAEREGTHAMLAGRRSTRDAA